MTHDTNIQKCIADIKDITLCLTDIKEWDRQRAIKELKREEDKHGEDHPAKPNDKIIGS